MDTAIKVTVRKTATELTWYTAGVSIGCEGSVSQRGYDGGDDQPRYLHNDYLASGLEHMGPGVVHVSQ